MRPDRVPVLEVNEALTFDREVDHSGATVPELHRLHSFVVTGQS
jgi:hypothetical protein